MSLDIQFKIYSTIEDLENVFLSQEIAPNIFVERVFYKTEYYYDDNTKEPEPTLKEQSRTRKRVYDCSKDLGVEFDVTLLNYDEFSSANWNHLVYGYLQWFSEEELPNCLKRIDKLIEQSSIDMPTKQFALTKLLNQVKHSVKKIQQIRKQNNVNTFKKDLLDVFIEIYNLFIANLQSKKYSNYIDRNNTQKKVKNSHKNYFTLSKGLKPSYEDLRNSLVSKSLISKTTNFRTLENAFTGLGTTSTKINWIGGKGKLGTFIKLLGQRENKVIIDNNHFEIAKNIFLDNGKTITSLREDKPKDAKNYIEELENIINLHFLSRKSNKS